MKLSQNLNDAINQQIMLELQNQNAYMQIASIFEDMQLKNLAKFFKEQASDEYDHANLFMDHLNDRNGGKVDIGEVNSPMITDTDINAIADLYVWLEQQTTESIEALYELALDEKSYIDLPFLLKMLDEQREEEDTSLRFSVRIKMVKDLVLFDAEFGD
jgi:ferritin